ncbi:hypothetical protein [Microbacterium sp. WCS2018Hpa-9]|uniref:hypothetical protein n=1 Tax=Microbacterium sp. WCS2018Hpa-9 TaxID=3073635 RepID=UPI002889C2D2|nr:hypothetical protein [Microbacterium sp. WCS2018Hpa-9]
MHAPSMRLRHQGVERVLILRVALALGLALLLVIGAWSTSHGKADAHTTLCLAPGASVASIGAHHDDTSAAETAPPDAGIVLVAALCCFLLVLLSVRSARGSTLIRHAVPVRASAPSRAGPRRHVPALTLAQLSLSRT